MPKSVIECSDLSAAEIKDIAAISLKCFKLISETKSGIMGTALNEVLEDKAIFLAFFEPSTRTRISFETAAKVLGAKTVLFTSADSSVVKGESFEDTAHTLAAMRPSLFVIRHSLEGSAQSLKKIGGVPVICGGEGIAHHPTQALLDAFTVHMEKPLWAEKPGTGVHHDSFKPLHLAIIGDVLNSRVARSNKELWEFLGHKVTLAVPNSLAETGEARAGETIAEFRDELLAEADVIMMLRIQRERIKDSLNKSDAELCDEFGLNGARLKKLRPDALILHPGPANVGVEISGEVYLDPRCRIRKQVTMGVASRAAVLAHCLGRLPELKEALISCG